MTYTCKIYDKDGKLKKEVTADEIKKRSQEELLNQKSTLLARKIISDYKDKEKPSKSTKFNKKKCIECGQDFYPRHRITKYCSHECQKKCYYNRKKLK